MHVYTSLITIDTCIVCMYYVYIYKSFLLIDRYTLSACLYTILSVLKFSA